MMKFSMKKVATAAMATVAVLAMSAGSALAAPVPTFTINSAAILGYAGTTVGDKFSGTSSELLTRTGPGPGTGHTGSGYLRFNSLDLLGNPVKFFGPVASTYNLFVTFDLVDTYQPGTGTGIDTPNSVNTVNVLDFRVFADPDQDNSFTQATVTGNVGTNAFVTDPGLIKDDIFLGFGKLIIGTDGFNSLGGAAFNSIEQFSLCTGVGASVSGTTNTSAQLPGAGGGAFAAGCASGAGKAFFPLPNPFYELAFTQFNNTTQGLTRSTNGTLTAINQATGAVDFNRVPEPGSMALLGIALAGLGISSRRGKNKAAKAA